MPGSGSIESETILSQVQKGMAVFDVNQEALGTVSDVLLGSTEAYDPDPVLVEAPVVGTPSQPMAGAMGTIGGTGHPRDFENEFPEHVRTALERQGCIKVKGGGVFGPVWYVTPDQIETITDEKISLKVAAREVIRSR